MSKNVLRTLMFAGACIALQCAAPAFAQQPGQGGGGMPMSQPPAGPGSNNPMAQDPTQTANMPVSRTDDKKFAKEAAAGGLAEVQLGNLAQQKASSSAVKQFAQKIVADHTRANDQLKEVAGKDGLTLPDQPDNKQKAKMDKLSKLSGTEFDRAYIKDELKDHEAVVRMFKSESENGTDPAIKAFAAKTLPVLEQHLNMVKELKKSGGAMSMNDAK